MLDPVFFPPALSPTLSDMAAMIGGRVAVPDDGWRASGLASLTSARAGDLAFFANPRHAPALARCRAGACILREPDRAALPPGVRALISDDPARAFARLAAILHRDALRPVAVGVAVLSPDARIDPSARLEPGVTVEQGATIGPRAEIGTGAIIGAHAWIGANVRVGRDCTIAPHVTLAHAFLGDRVIIHAGARIGQDGFGFVPGHDRHTKIAQIGRVILQDDVEIGANTTIDRGALDDTIVGQGTKIDNLVQIAHNVVVGRHCLIAAQAGIAGSTIVGDFVMIGGQAGIGGHIRIGDGARIAGKSGVLQDVAPGARVGGSPAARVDAFLRAAIRGARHRNA